MNGRTAKALRKKIYGVHGSIRERSYFLAKPKDGNLIITMFADQKRRAYKMLKRSVKLMDWREKTEFLKNLRINIQRALLAATSKS